MKKAIKLAIFNTCFAALTILCFSKRTLGLSFNPDIGALKFALTISLSIFGTLSFFYFNYMLLNKKVEVIYKKSKLSNIEECITALENCKKTDPAFIQEIETAIRQLHTLERREKSLSTLLEHNNASESFSYLLNTGKTANLHVFNNTKRIINRLIVFDNEEYVETYNTNTIQPHKEYINEVLKDTDTLLHEYNNLLLAISGIGETEMIDITEIQTMTEALNHVFKGDRLAELDKKYSLPMDTNNTENT